MGFIKIEIMKFTSTLVVLNLILKLLSTDIIAEEILITLIFKEGKFCYCKIIQTFENHIHSILLYSKYKINE